MDLVIHANGLIRGIYSETIDLHLLGPLQIVRASHVEPDSEGRWFADLSPRSGPCLGPFQHRSEALQAEALWLQQHLES